MRFHTKITSAMRSPDWRARYRCAGWLLINCALLMALSPRPLAQEKKRAVQGTKPEALVTPAEATNLEAVIMTDLGVIRFEFFADKAPHHAQQFIKWAREGFYD